MGLVNHTTATWQLLDTKHFLHPFTDHKALHATGSRIIESAEGIYLWDSDGNRILDGMAGLWCVNVGYGRTELAEVAREQMEKLPYYNTFFQTAHPPVIELSELLADVTPDGFNRAFFTNSGSESIDTVVRMARHYWSLLGQPTKQIIISRTNAYHGSTMAGASLCGMPHIHSQGGLPIPGITHIGQPYWYREGGNQSPEDFGRAVAQQLEQKIQELGEHQVAAFIAEPIQGAGGVIIPPTTYWPEITDICRRHQILLVADEVICGFGRTGQWFGADTYKILPDLMPIAKGLSSGYLPIGAVMIADHIANVLIEEGGEFFHGMTYSGHPVACAVSSANIRILRDENIIQQVGNDTGPYLQKKWQKLADHPLVGEARGLGFLGALELVESKSKRKTYDPLGHAGAVCRDAALSNGLIMRAVGDTMIISPPLVMTREQIDELVVLAEQSLDDALTSLRN
ncbi:MAG: aspartate aminotransferase family protein [Acidiferrobacteraceae bacterium]|nr:aspartate aminotransferase family protein [Acidiferrobacteraceae bacterium]